MLVTAGVGLGTIPTCFDTVPISITFVSTLVPEGFRWDNQCFKTNLNNENLSFLDIGISAMKDDSYFQHSVGSEAFHWSARNIHGSGTDLCGTPFNRAKKCFPQKKKKTRALLLDVEEAVQQVSLKEPQVRYFHRKQAESPGVKRRFQICVFVTDLRTEAEQKSHFRIQLSFHLQTLAASRL